MLAELSIRGYALIDSLRICFHKGLNVLTGETGAGKSIIIDALGMLLGEKASGNVLRSGAERCQIAGTLDIQNRPEARAWLKSSSLENGDDPDMLFLRREIDAQGKSKSFINDRPVTLASLAALGELLVDIHGQHEYQRLLKTGEQRALLDRFAGNAELLEKVESLYGDWQRARAELDASQLSEQEKNQKIDLYRFQVQEIEAARLAPNEEEEIERILPQLKNAGRLRELLEESHSQLYDAEGSVLERLRRVQKGLSAVANLGVELKESPAHIEEALVRAGEAVDEIERLQRNLSADPGKVDELIGRQDLIFRLKKKYGATVPEILAYREKVKQDLEALENHSRTLEELESRCGDLRRKLLKACHQLGSAREKQGQKLSAAVEKELKDLGFAKAKFSVQLGVEKDEKGEEIPGAHGFEKVEFFFSANPGEEARPLRGVASGGELSRLMLAIENVLAQADPVGTLIFDEIDAGIGGSMGRVVGEKLKSLSRSHQILLITHLPQIAAYADLHAVVRKRVEGGKSRTLLEILPAEERPREIARMLGGSAAGSSKPTEVSLQHAAELLQSAR